jgi:hypothetical protein
MRRSIHRATKIERVRDRIHEKPEITHNGIKLDALAALPAPDQRKVVAMIEIGKAGTVREATRLISAPRSATSPRALSGPPGAVRRGGEKSALNHFWIGCPRLEKVVIFTPIE